MASAVNLQAEGQGPLDTPSNTRVNAKTGEAEGVPAALIVGAIALLVVLVSLPRFRAHVLRANRADATNTLNRLGAYVFAEKWQAALVPEKTPQNLFALIEFEPRLTHRFPDARRAQADSGGVQLLHHGYLFDTGQVMDGSFSVPALVAWPAEFGRTGDAAYARTKEGAVYAHRNGGLWSGVNDGLFHADLTDEGWRRVR